MAKTKKIINFIILGMTIKMHCKAHLASATESVTVLGSNSDQKSITVMGSTKIEPVGCK